MYSFESRIRYSECDERSFLSIPAMVNYLQDCSTFHSESLGLGIEHMARLHLAWFINCWQIEILRMPHFCDTVSISTWCHSMKRTTAMRNYLIADSEGNQIVRADSLWFVFDTEKKRPIRVPESEYAYDTHETPLDMPVMQRRIRTEGDFELMAAYEVAEHHLDSNRHVNNAQYVAMAASALEAAAQHPIVADNTRLRVSYRRMALLGDTIVPRVQVGPQAQTVILDSAEGDPFAIVRLEPLQSSEK